jgi:hypothetical protein
MTKVDLRKELKPYYSASSKTVEFLDVPTMSFLMIDGKGDPGEAAAYRQAIEALYAVAYTVKFAVKNSASGTDYVVPPLQGLWWADDMSDFVTGKRDNWQWTLMIMQPEWVTAATVAAGIEVAGQKKDLPSLPLLRFESYSEGAAAQVLHVGPYADEGPTIEKLHDSIAERGLELRGRHHEIYLSDPRRVDPARLKTIIRQPVATPKATA